MKNDDEFYIGYLPKAPAATAGFTRRVVAGGVTGAWAVGAFLAVVLPFYGAGVFEFGHPKVYRGTVVCDGVPHLSAGEIDYLLVGPGKHGVPLEVCAAKGRSVSVEATRMARGGREVLEVVPQSVKADDTAVSGPAITEAPLGEFTLRGEIVDPKCYFGVMNPGEGRLHRACAILCLRGGITPVLVVRDRNGAEVHVALRVPAAEAGELLRRVAEPVEISGTVHRSGHWLVMDTRLEQIHGVTTR